MKLYLTDEQREHLALYENYLHTAYYSDYVVGLPRKAVSDLVEVYNKVFSAHERPTSCPVCALNVCKKLGRLYYGPNE